MMFTLLWVAACNRAPVNPLEQDADGDGYSISSGDCDDADDSAHPGAADVLQDGVDSDCDGSDGASEDLTNAPSFRSPIDDVQVGVGSSLASGDVDGDGDHEILVGCDDLDPEGFFRDGHAWLLDGPALAPTAEWHGDDVGSLTSELGKGLAIGELTGGGDLDLVIREMNHLYILAGPAWPGADLSGPGVRRIRTDSDVEIGNRLITAAVTGEPAADLVVECGDYRGEGNELWGVCVVAGPVGDDLDLVDADVIIQGDQVGSTLAAPDLDGDGAPDLAMGGDTVNADAGVVHVLLGPLPAGELDTADADASFHGEAAGDWLGQEAADVGDVDGDGLADLAVSAMGWPGHERRGQVRVLHLDTPDLASASFTVDGEDGVQHLGRAIVGADVDDDGQADLVLGAPSYEGFDPTKPGRVAVFYGPLEGRRSAADADRAWVGEHPGDAFGVEIVAGDVDGDGSDDLVVAATGNDDVNQSAGKIYLLLGP